MEANRKKISIEDYKTVIDVPIEGIIDEEATSIFSNENNKVVLEDKRCEHVIIPQACLQKRIAELAREIHDDNLESENLHFLIILTGAFIFAADLGRALYDVAPKDAIFSVTKASTYQDNIKTTGEKERKVRILLDPGDLAGKDIIIVEDLIDQGFTLTALKKYLLTERNANSVKICALLNKKLDNPTPEVKKIREELKIDYSGFYVPDVWVAGYGLDAGNFCRHMPFIFSINQNYYK